MEDLIRYYKVEEPFERHEENYLVLSEKKGEIVTLNETSFFIWDNCDRKNINEIVSMLEEVCENGAELDICLIKNDCRMAIDKMVEKGLILERNVK